MQTTLAPLVVEAMAATHFLGHDLVRAIGEFATEGLLGPWPGHTPAEKRPRRRFTAALFHESDSHPDVELCIVLEGRCAFSFNHYACHLRAGDVVVIPDMLPHAETYRDAQGGYSLAWWCLEASEPQIHFTRYSHDHGFTVEHSIKLTSLPAEAARRIEFLREMARRGEAPEIDRVREALLTVTLGAYRRVLEGHEAQLDNRATLVRRAVEFIRAHAETPLTLGEVARVVRVSPNYLTSLFRAQTGAPLGQFVLRERIALAQEMLKRPESSVKTVALDIGFSDPFTFSRAFKRVTGSTPSAWMAAARAQSAA